VKATGTAVASCIGAAAAVTHGARFCGARSQRSTLLPPRVMAVGVSTAVACGG
jgi:hypothetical protein